MVSRCCSASVSVGAMKAPWWPFSTARSSVCTATTVLPEPTSPCSSRRIGVARSRSASISAMAFTWWAVSAKGRPARKADDVSPAAPSAGALLARCSASLWSSRPSCMSSSSSSTSRSRADGRLGVRARRVDGQHGVGLGGQALGGAQRARQRIGHAARRAPDLVHEVAQHARRDALARRVDGHDALGVHGLALAGQDLVGLDHERGAAAREAHAAAQAEHHARLEHLGQPGLVEPDADHDAGLVAQHGLEQGDAAPVAVVERDALDRRPHRGLLAHLEVGDRLAVGEILVAARVVREQVAHGLKAEAGQALGQGRPHAGKLGERPGESGGVGSEARRPRPLVVPAAAEAHEGSGPRSLHDHREGEHAGPAVGADDGADAAVEHDLGLAAAPRAAPPRGPAACRRRRRSR